MRFKASEFKDIQSLIVKAKLDPMDFTNVKKRGRLHIQYKDGQTFIFFRRTQMLLDEDKKWVRQSSYEVGPAKKLIGEGLDWEGVKKLFGKWVKKL